MIPWRVSLPGVSYPGESVSPAGGWWLGRWTDHSGGGGGDGDGTIGEPELRRLGAVGEPSV